MLTFLAGSIFSDGAHAEYVPLTDDVVVGDRELDAGLLQLLVGQVEHVRLVPHRVQGRLERRRALALQRLAVDHQRRAHDRI